MHVSFKAEPFKMAPWVLMDDVSVAGAAGQSWSFEQPMNIAAGCWHPDSAYREVVAEARDLVSAAELTAHVLPSRLAFVSADAMLVPPGAAAAVGQTVTGVAFAEALSQAPAPLRVESGELVMTFVDDRLGGFLTLREPAPAAARVVAAPVVEDAGASVFRLRDNTVIRLTGMIQGITRRALGATEMIGLGGASFAT